MNALVAAPPIGGATRLFAIVGDPVDQVRSPEMFNDLFVALGCDAVLVPMHVAAAEFDDVLPRLKRLRNLDGFIITIPHKVAAVRHADRLLPTAAQVGAVNALARGVDGRWVGDMFDGQGFLAGLTAEGCPVASRRVYLAGAGGVGRAIAFALAEAGVSTLAIRDVDRARADDLVRALARHHRGVAASACDGPTADYDLAVNATPLGMKADDPLPFDLSALAPSTWIAEVIMKPDVTPLLLAARARGHRVMPGRRLLEQQLRPIARFFGLPA